MHADHILLSGQKGNEAAKNNLFVDSEDPSENVWVMFVRHMLHGEYLAILLGSGTVRPEARIDLKSYIMQFSTFYKAFSLAH